MRLELQSIQNHISRCSYIDMLFLGLLGIEAVQNT